MYFELREDLVVVVLDHLILCLLLPDCPFEIGDPEVKGLVVEPLCLCALILFEALDIEVDAVLRVDVFDVPAVEIGRCLLLDDVCLFEDYLALLLLDLHVGHRHLLVQILYLVLNLKDLLLEFLFLFQALHHEVGQLFGQVLPLLSLGLHTCLDLGNGVLEGQALLLPRVFVGGSGREGCPVPHRLPAEFELDDVLLDVSEFVAADALIIEPILEVVLQSFVLLRHDCVEVLEFLLVALDGLLHHVLGLQADLVLFCSEGAALSVQIFIHPEKLLLLN